MWYSYITYVKPKKIALKKKRFRDGRVNQAELIKILFKIFLLVQIELFLLKVFMSPQWLKDWTDKLQLGQMENPLQTHTVEKGLACNKGMPTPTTAGRVLAALSTYTSPL